MSHGPQITKGKNSMQKLPSYFQGFRAHLLDGKTVEWNTLQRVGKNDFQRIHNFGKVLAVSPCGGIAMVNRLPYNEAVEVEVSELDTLND